MNKNFMMFHLFITTGTVSEQKPKLEATLEPILLCPDPKKEEDNGNG